MRPLGRLGFKHQVRPAHLGLVVHIPYLTTSLSLYIGYGGGMQATSSPLAFPSSELGSSARRATGSRAGAGPSQLSSDGGVFRSPAVRRTQEPLFFPG